MKTTKYGITKVLRGVTFEGALERVHEALKAEGFGVLCEINVAETLKKKLGVDLKRYVILGACNPPLAHKALVADEFVGLLLPCNVIVFEDGEEVVVSAVDPSELFKVVGNPQVEPIASEVRAKLERVMERV